ncbi:GLPGLI family protein [Elizabethkingia ursingii]|uniref:GLPGLI family protein n=1 Tax=Elizabethkingia ursingii TaxID=1756150 RepID=UPI0009EC556C|nr:GLPGLI family protein [Elizabethkingia ursingii]
MKTLQLFIFCITTLYFSQNIRFVYQVRMKTDSTHRDQVKSELANLDINKTNSVFYAAKAILRDSIMDSNKKNQIGYISKEQFKMTASNIGYQIDKNYKKQEVSYNAAIAKDIFIYTELKPFNWKITTETKKIGAYNTQKAQTQYAGRTWYAWFTTEVPFQDGPYKFCGLPGLIVKAEDSKGDYQFELVETRKIPALYKAPSPWKQPIIVKKEEFLKVYKKVNADPIAFRPASPISANSTSQRIDSDLNADKKYRDEVTKRANSFNNPIEFD